MSRNHLISQWAFISIERCRLAHKCTLSHTPLIAACWSTKLTPPPPASHYCKWSEQAPLPWEACVLPCVRSPVLSACSRFRRAFMKSHRKVFVFMLHASMLRVEVISPESIGRDESNMTSNVSRGRLNMCIAGCGIQANTCKTCQGCSVFRVGVELYNFSKWLVVLILPKSISHERARPVTNVNRNRSTLVFAMMKTFVKQGYGNSM